MLVHLDSLLTGNLDEVTQEGLIQGVKDAEMCLANGQKWSGQFIARLKQRHGLSWPVLARLTGVSKGTLIRRAQPYL